MFANSRDSTIVFVHYHRASSQIISEQANTFSDIHLITPLLNFWLSLCIRIKRREIERLILSLCPHKRIPHLEKYYTRFRCPSPVTTFELKRNFTLEKKEERERENKEREREREKEKERKKKKKEEGRPVSWKIRVEMKSLVKRNIIRANGDVNRCTRGGNVINAMVIQMFFPVFRAERNP